MARPTRFPTSHLMSRTARLSVCSARRVVAKRQLCESSVASSRRTAATFSLTARAFFTFRRSVGQPAWSFSDIRSGPILISGTMSPSDWNCAALPARKSIDRSERLLSWLVCPVSSDEIRPSYRADNSSGSPWRERSCWSRASCCSTSPYQISTPNCGSACETSCPRFSAESASPPCW